ncbi:uncharacterized protein B0J16DRAFT_415295 [Fusarium flagelliforme]|uniref:Ribokinase-like protein n=1 Tax=Fusarium flagelliforme TaxID=2675880 RepID=A0A395MNE8_9HYPO|nr:uncharacterized protein B0J16DRAFT_415295 [Fusarium flagelliforme]KAH7185998.1 hypothetical protein B0J16DRAFT_415295 [Fusarium flagelliforme]RFN49471.1 ribokinase-like protein [Fusarium flagelliforme]
MTREPFDVQVHWPADNINNWPDKNGDFYKKTGIHMYRITKDDYNPFYTYEVKIRADWPFTYTFYDESGDDYSVSIWMVGMNEDHTVKFNSDRPTIVRVTGS